MLIPRQRPNVAEGKDMRAIDGFVSVLIMGAIDVLKRVHATLEHFIRPVVGETMRPSVGYGEKQVVPNGVADVHLQRIPIDSSCGDGGVNRSVTLVGGIDIGEDRSRIDNGVVVVRRIA